ncbi:MAG: flagellar biosynthesis protein FlhF [Gammaproteobacteria bacterium]|nr:flagellar biosynthesis protein FlhF [Gammaproteobacteria bacterium]
MKMKRYFAADIRQAMAMVRNEQGADAVILSSRNIDGGIEIVAAIDYDQEMIESASTVRAESVAHKTQSAAARSIPASEGSSRFERQGRRERFEVADDSRLIRLEDELGEIKNILQNNMAGLAWQGITQRSNANIDVIKKLYAIGITSNLCLSLAAAVSNIQDSKSSWRMALATLADQIRIIDEEMMVAGGVYALIGPTGVGKTTSIAKIAARYALQRGVKKIALITVDNHRVAAHEQFRTYARLIGVPSRCVHNKEEMVAALAEFSSKELVLVDTAGMSQYDSRVCELDQILNIKGWNIKKALTLPAAGSYQVLKDVIAQYGMHGVNQVIVTKIDEAPSIGALLSAIVDSGLPVSYLCDGQQVPEDIRSATAADLVSKCVSVGRAKPLVVDQEILAIDFGREAINA